jgi:FkbM family methyltransferase
MLLEHIGRQLHHENRPHVPQQRGGAAQNVAFKSVDVEFDELYFTIHEFRQHAVKASGPRRLRSHFPAEMLRMQAGLAGQRPTRIDRRRHKVFIALGEETMASGYAGLEFRVELEVAGKLAKRVVGRLERDDAAIGADQLGKMKRVRADIGPDVRHQRSRRDKLAQRRLGPALVDVSEVNREIYPLRKIKLVIDASPYNDVPIGAAKHGAAGSNNAINGAGAGNLMGRFHRKFQFVKLNRGLLLADGYGGVNSATRTTRARRPAHMDRSPRYVISVLHDRCPAANPQRRPIIWMFQSLIRNSAVQLFGLAAKLSVHRLPLFDRIFLVLYAGYKRHFEAGPIERLEEFIPTGSVAIDVGANVGFFSLRFARWVGSGGEVIAIEPEERNYETPVAALKRQSPCGRVRALKAVAAATAGPMFLEINQLHPADHKLSRDGTGVAVEAVRLDDLVQDTGVRKASLVKIDVQGARCWCCRARPIF